MNLFTYAKKRYSIHSIPRLSGYGDYDVEIMNSDSKSEEFEHEKDVKMAIQEKDKR